LAEAEVALLAVPGYAHRAVIDAATPHLHQGQIVIISSHMSLSALYLSQSLAERGVSLPIVAWGTTIVTGRQTNETEVRVSNLRARVDVATISAARAEHGLQTCRALFGDHFVPRSDLLAISLSNVNPQNHLAMALCNFTRIERGETWMNYAGVTESVGRLLERLDDERLAVAAAYGCSVRTVQEHFRLSFNVEGDTIADMARVLAARDTTPGPVSANTRYVTEDVPYGLVTTSRLAAIAGVKVPLHDAGIAIFSAMYGRDFAAENELLPAIGLDRMSRLALQRAARDGWQAASTHQ
jgi:opine dehydrogenase